MTLRMIVTIAVALLVAQQSFASGNVIDSERADIASIAQKLCGDPSARISKLSTVAKLSDYYETGHLSQSGFSECEAEFRDSVYDLSQLLKTGSDNVCGFVMVAKLSEFHWNYIVGSLLKKRNVAPHGFIPESIREFFINYANEVAEVCKQNVIGNLDLAASNKMTKSDEIFSQTLNKRLESLRTFLVPKSKVKNYEDFSLPWELIINQLKRKGKIPDDLIDESGDMFVMVLKMQNTDEIHESQRLCRFDLRPIYQETVLPVMRLIDMGYGSTDKSLENEVTKSEMLKNWYEITQVCELLLPIYVHRDENLGESEAVIVNTEEEFDKIFAVAEPLVSRRDIPSTTNVHSIQLQDTVKVAKNGKKLLETVKSNMKKRAHIYRKLTRNVATNTKNRFKSGLKSIFVSHKSRTGALTKDQPDESQLESSFDELLDDDDNESHGSHHHSLRHKRSVGSNDLVRQKRSVLWDGVKNVLLQLRRIAKYVLVIGIIAAILVAIVIASYIVCTSAW